MRICFWTDNINTPGGVQKIVSMVSNELSKFYDVTILTNVETNAPFYHLSENIHLEKIPFSFDCHSQRSVLGRFNKRTGILNALMANWLLKKIYFYGQDEKEVAGFFNNKNYDLIVGVHCYNSLYLSILSKYLHSKVIGWQHNCFDAIFNIKNRYLNNMKSLCKAYFKKLDSYIVLNKEDKTKIDNLCHINSKIICNATDLNLDFDLSLKKNNIISIGRFTDAKGLDYLLKALSVVFVKHPDWNATIVGDGPLKDEIIFQAKNLHIDSKISFPGYIKNVGEYLKESSIYALPSKWEGMPLVVLEAFEAALPVVSFDISACRSLNFNNYSGISQIQLGDYESFASSINYLIENEETRKRFACNAYRKSQDFKPDKIIKEWNLFIFNLFFEGIKNNKIKLYETRHSVVEKANQYVIKRLKGNYKYNYSFKRELFSTALVNRNTKIHSRELVAFNEDEQEFIFKYICDSGGRPERLTKEILLTVNAELNELKNITVDYDDYEKFLNRNMDAITSFEKIYNSNDFKRLFFEKHIKSFVHGDVSRSNIVFNNNIAYLIDFENSGCGLDGWDKCYFISSFLYDDIDEIILKELSQYECKLVLLTLQVAIGRLIKHEDPYYIKRKESYDKFLLYFKSNQLKDEQLL